MLWAIRWAAMLTSRFLVGADGRTAYERRRGRRCNLECVPFGEYVWFKQVREGNDRTNKTESEWSEGIWLGHARQSNEHVIGTEQGVVRAYTVKRKEEGQRWT